ncbi:MAG: hypothetical protein ACKV22_39930 [Bryobacteraceae bacterium]
MRTIVCSLVSRAAPRVALVAAVMTAAAFAGTFGTVVPIGGQAADIALDEARGVLYVANFTANRVEVMNLADRGIPRSINVGPFPASLALSPDGQFLVVAHYGNFAAPATSNNTVTIVNLNNNQRTTLVASSTPLGVAFGNDGKCLLATKVDVSLLDPATGVIEVLNTISSLASKTLPIPGPAPPAEITETTLGVSADGARIYGSTEAFGLIYDVASKQLSTFPTKGAVPALAPRAVSVARDGSYFAFGWAVWDSRGRFRNDFTNVTGQLAVGSFAVDSVAGVIYAQVPEQVQIGPPGPVLRVLDAENLAVRQWLYLAENLSGKSLLSADRSNVYAVSDSGVTILPVGRLDREARVDASRPSLSFRTTFCDRRTATQEVLITDPSGNPTDFALKSSIPGVTLSPASGLTPATVRVSVDPAAFESVRGTVSATITITSNAAVNAPDPIRVFINNREPDQRGSIVAVAGSLVDLLADPIRDRFYVLRQDSNEVLVFDGSNFNQVAALRTNSTPTQMAITRDGKHLLVGHEHAWNANVYDLDTLRAATPIQFPYAHYPLSLAVSGRAVLALTDNREVGRGYNTIDRVDFDNRSAAELPTLGAFENKFDSFVTLAGSANGASIFGAASNGSTILYDSSADTFTVFRKDFPGLSGAFAASNQDQYFVGSSLLNSSLVATRRLSTDSGVTAGFYFFEDVALRVSAKDSTSPGVIEQVNLRDGAVSRSVRLIEAPKLPSPGQSTVGRINNPFTRSLAPLANRNSIVMLSQSGFVVLPFVYDANQPQTPRISLVVNAADNEPRIATGGLISIYGTGLHPVALATSEVPLPFALGEACVTIGNRVIPLRYVAPGQINAQVPFEILGPAPVVVRNSGGVSAPFNITAAFAAPAIFRTGIAGPNTNLPLIVRKANNQLVTLSNPVRRGDELSIFLTGLGATIPAIATGFPGSTDPKAIPLIEPSVFLDEVELGLVAAEMQPGEVGVYRIDVQVPAGVRQGLQIPLKVAQGSAETVVAVRVIEGNN